MEKEKSETTAMQNDTVLPPQLASLFPVHLQPSSSGNEGVPEWLRNASFTTDLSVINDAVSSRSKAQQPSECESEDEEVKEEQKDGQPQYELLDSLVSDRDAGNSSSEEWKIKKRRRKRKRKMSSDAPPLYDYTSSRKPDVRTWSSSSSATNSKDYYFDARGDRDNLAFGCLYRMDVARYKLYNSMKTSGLSYYRSRQWSSFSEGDDDIDSLDNKLRSGGRYWSLQYAALERHRNLKRMRVLAPEKMMSSLCDDFIPLLDESSDGRSPSTATTVEESWEDEVLRKTKEFNRLTRERPHDEKVWSAFSEFQDKVASMQPQKGARLQTLEKKISILEKAVELNPDNEDLILSLMKAYQNRESTDVLIGRWEKTLMKNSGSYRLWKEFLQVIQGEFSRFKVSEMRKMYANAIHALSGACSRRYRQVHHGIAGPSVDTDLALLEVGLVEIFLSLCRFEWQTGYQELATALLQAEIEYSLFSPSLYLSEQSKQGLFEHFWNSNGARIGEDGALGWSTWLGKEEQERQKLVSDDLCQNVQGGWTGWSEPLSKTKESEILEDDKVSDIATLESGHEHDTGDVDENDDTLTLLKRLGIDTATDANTEVKDARTWARWSVEELQRDSDQWMPLHTTSETVNILKDDAEGDEQLSRVILYEDVTDYLFSLTSEEARLSLVSQFIEFFGGRISQWTCTNSSSWTEGLISLEVISYSILDQLQRVYDVVAGKDTVSRSICLESLVNNSDDISMKTSMMKFVRNATLLCLTVFPQNHILKEAVLIAEELSNTQIKSSTLHVTPCRGLAKSLLKSNRQDILLCGVYARREAAFGNIDQARKIFDMALSSTEGLPLDAHRNSPLLHFWYAEMELANISINRKESLYRAMHILSCLGSGVKYSPYIGQPCSLQQLRARQGFKEQIRILRSTWTRGVIDNSSISLICSAVLFEELTAGPAAGMEILDDAFAMVLPERRRNNYQLEQLFNYYVSILCKHHKELKLSRIWEAILKGLQMYPFSPALYGALVEISHLHTSPCKLRWILDDYSSKKQSLVAFLFSLSFEISKGSLPHRIRAMFERALVHGKFHNSVVVWRWYIAYESDAACDPTAARRVFFRAIHACPWSKKLWLDGFLKLNSVLTAKELSDLQDVMRDKEINLRTDIYEILLQDEMDV